MASGAVPHQLGAVCAEGGGEAGRERGVGIGEQAIQLPGEGLDGLSIGGMVVAGPFVVSVTAVVS
jgi:hypothetical protein